MNAEPGTRRQGRHSALSCAVAPLLTTMPTDNETTVAGERDYGTGRVLCPSVRPLLRSRSQNVPNSMGQNTFQ